MTFYRFGGAYKKSAIRIQSEIKYNTLDILYTDSPLIQKNVFYIDRGKKIFDILEFSDSSNFAISKKVKELFEVNNITGWACFPIIIKGISEEYFGFQTLSKAGRILNLEAVNRYETENREFDINTWDGSDIFNLEETLLSVCTPRVKEILEKSKVTNLEFKTL